MEVLTRTRYKELMEEFGTFRLPKGWMFEYVHNKFPETVDNPDEFEKKLMLCRNVKRGYSFDQGLENGIITDFLNKYEELKKQHDNGKTAE